MKTLHLYVKAEASAGADIAEVVVDMVELAARIGTPIECGLNGVTTIAYPGDKAGDLFMAWQAALNSSHQVKIALVRP